MLRSFALASGGSLASMAPLAHSTNPCHIAPRPCARGRIRREARMTTRRSLAAALAAVLGGGSIGPGRAAAGGYCGGVSAPGPAAMSTEKELS